MNSSFPTAGLDRRAFFRGSAIAAFAILGTGSLAACSSAVGEQRSDASESVEPVRGGTLTLAIPDDVSPSALLTSTTIAGTTISGLVFETLTRYPIDSVVPQPLLAKDWKLSDDGLTLTLNLRDDVTFHTGRPFTSADAEFSLRTYADPKFSAQLRSTAAAITGYDSSDPKKLVLTLAHRTGNIFDLLDLAPIFDSETFDKAVSGESFIGTGPFVFASRTPNSSISFDRNPNYWVAERPFLDRVEARIVPDSQARLTSLKSGQVALVAPGSLTFRDSQTVGKTSGFATSALDGAELQTYLGANVTAEGLTDVRTRKAVAYAIDRDRIMSEVYRDAGYAVNLPWPKSSPAYDAAKNSTYTRDVAKARSLVSEVGTLPTIPLTYTGASPDFEAAAQIVQANLAEAGIRVELDPVEATIFFKQLIGAEFKGLWLTSHTFAQYVPSTLTVSAYPFNAAHNASKFSSPAYSAAADSAWQVPDGSSDAAKKLYADLGTQLLEELFLIEIGVVVPQVSAASTVHDLAWTKSRQPQFANTFLA
ncbi:ABC transporter substrate-binding protein [Rhodococcus sp. AD45-ID]|uniref:ABC transporter substrate-binding protein n=1 Tax=unclassified Rhodococcus (in: high G+C Gram-positive bacteria) TaxID=192944 RepID=UPI0005D33463|nr:MULTISPECIES: ABC transporter substrate-binding protein [unclassified Rhodococcus (in: high G+C Gram-positive bacteria)]KJF19573.1 Hemin-binding lipoprotein [Rhodococcus sp. AD45]PSR39299.1 ABC transporter substrate-binding protein [Rhodococcus sp. AD45-ID]